MRAGARQVKSAGEAVKTGASLFVSNIAKKARLIPRPVGYAYDSKVVRRRTKVDHIAAMEDGSQARRKTFTAWRRRGKLDDRGHRPWKLINECICGPRTVLGDKRPDLSEITLRLRC